MGHVETYVQNHVQEIDEFVRIYNLRNYTKDRNSKYCEGNYRKDT